MVKVSKEVKIGLSVLIIAFLFIWGFNFLKGKDVFNPGYVGEGVRVCIHEGHRQCEVNTMQRKDR